MHVFPASSFCCLNDYMTAITLQMAPHVLLQAVLSGHIFLFLLLCLLTCAMCMVLWNPMTPIHGGKRHTPVLRCYGRTGETKDERAKWKNGESVRQEWEREALKIEMTIDFQSKPPTVTQPFSGRTQIKARKKRRGRGRVVLILRAAKEVRCWGQERWRIQSHSRTGCVTELLVPVCKDVSFDFSAPAANVSIHLSTGSESELMLSREN